LPNIKSVLKDVYKSRERHIKNKSAKAAIKTAMKKSNIAIAGGDAQAAATQVVSAVKLIDKTAAKGIIHKNAAARRKSRLMKRLAKSAA
jgi:small subunit ribosomal protein S20